tara:strand:+ start:364 stop:699 length:336 start_codon:yes stop_codon:yes gene_type:complete
MLNNFYPDDLNRVGCPADSCVSDNTNIATTPELLAILDCDIIFWEAYSADGLVLPFSSPTNDYQHARNRGVEKSFEDIIRSSIATQDYEALGRLVSAQMQDYAASIWAIRS